MFNFNFINLKLEKNNDRKSTMIDKFEITVDVGLGIEAFHSNGFVHRDIKPENVLFKEKFSKHTDMISARLADYGEAYDLNSEEYIYIRDNIDLDEFDCLVNYDGTIKYASPEVLQGNLRLLTEKADIYSYGILIWEVFTERPPFENYTSDPEFSNDILEEKLTPLYEKDINGELKKIEYLPGTPKEIDELVKNCLSWDPKDRPTIAEVIEEIIRIQKKYGFNNSTR